MTHLPSDFEGRLLSSEPDVSQCREVEDFFESIADHFPYQLGLTLEWIREHTGLRSEDISIIDGVALKVIVHGCIQQLRTEREQGAKHLMDIPFEAADRWLSERFDVDVLALMRISGGDREISREYLRRTMADDDRIEIPS
jgi:hypothetical protein